MQWINKLINNLWLQRIIVGIIISYIVYFSIEYPKTKKVKKFHRNKIETIINEADQEMKIRNYDKALKKYEEALKEFAPKEFPKLYAYIKEKEGDIYSILPEEKEKNLIKSIQLYEESFSFIRYVRLYRKIAKSYIGLSHIRNRKKNLQKAEEFFMVALKAYHSENIYEKDSLLYASVCKEVGDINWELAKIEGKDFLRKSAFYYEEALKIFIKEDMDRECGSVYISLGNVYSELYENNGNREYLLKSVEFFKKALDIFDAETSGYEYSLSNFGLAVTLSIKSKIITNKEEKIKMIKKAIILYQESLKFRSPHSREYYDVEINLGTAYGILFDILRDESYIKKSIKYYEDAMKFFNIKKRPVDYAFIQERLGVAYGRLSSIRNAKKNLLKSIDYFKESLKIYTIKNYPYEYARTNRSLGYSFVELARESRDFQIYEVALQSFERALNVYDMNEHTMEYFDLLYDVSNISLMLYQKLNKEEYLEKAFDKYNEMLEIIKHNKEVDIGDDKMGILWGNLGYCYAKFYEHNHNLESIYKAIDCYEKSLKVFSILKYPIKYAMINSSLGYLYSNLFRISKKEEFFQLGIKYYESALKVYDSNVNKYFVEYARIYNSLGDIYFTLFEKTTQKEDILNALSHYNKAVKVINERKGDESLYIIAAGNLGISYFFLSLLQDKKKNLLEAIRLQEEVVSKIKTPTDSIRGLVNLGLYYFILSTLENEDKNIEKSLLVYKKALSICDRHEYSKECTKIKLAIKMLENKRYPVGLRIRHVDLSN